MRTLPGERSSTTPIVCTDHTPPLSVGVNALPLCFLARSVAMTQRWLGLWPIIPMGRGISRDVGRVGVVALT